MLISLCAVALVGVAQPARARALSAKNRVAIQCAREKMGILFEIFDVHKDNEKKVYSIPPECNGGRAKEVKIPEWFIPELTRMEATKVFYSRERGTLSERDLWGQAFSNVYVFLDRADKSLDPSQPIVLDQLSRGYVGNRINLLQALDFLNKDLSRGTQVLIMKDSMEGRGRSLLATFELINNEFFSTIESFSSAASKREDKYRKSVMAVVVLANHLFNQFFASPIPEITPDSAKVYRVTKQERGARLAMMLLGAVFAGFAVFLFLENKRSQIDAYWEEYKQKSSVWAEDVNRQFVTMDIKYIVFGI